MSEPGNNKLITVKVETDDKTWGSICEHGDPSEVAEMTVKYHKAEEALTKS